MKYVNVLETADHSGGAISKQGLSVARTLLESQRYRVRALNRNIHSPIAQELASLGAELIEISIQSDEHAKLVAVFADSTDAFLMTTGTKTHETTLGCRLADAAVEARVEHIIFSSLENVDKISEGQLWVPHFTDKGKIEEYIRMLSVGCSFIQMAFFYTNLLEYYQLRREGGTLIFPVYLPEDFQATFVDPLTATWPAVLAMFDNREMYTGCTLPVIGEFISPRELIETFCRVRGLKAVYSSVVTPKNCCIISPRL